MIKAVKSALAAALALAIAMPVAANAALLPDEQGFARMRANIVDVDEHGGRVTVRPLIGGRPLAGGQLVTLYINDETFVVDAVSGMNTSLDERENDLVSVYHSSEVTISERTVADALVIIVNIPPGYTPPTFHIVDPPGVVTAGGGGPFLGAFQMDNGQNSAWINIAPQWTEHIRTSTGAVVTAHEYWWRGSKILVWWHNDRCNLARRVVELTHGQVSPEEMQKLRLPRSEEIGYTLNISDAREIDGEVWVPLRQVAEGLGYEVIWDDGRNPLCCITIRLGGVGFWRDVSQSAMVHVDRGTVPNARQFYNRTYVPLLFFETYSGRVERVNDEIIFFLP